MNVVTEKASVEVALVVDFVIVELTCTQKVRRAFVLGRVARSELPSPAKINFDDAARYL